MDCIACFPGRLAAKKNSVRGDYTKVVLSVLLLLLVMVPLCLSARFTLLLAMPNTSTPFSVGRIGAAALIAIDAVNNSTEILPGHQLDFQYVDDECDDLVGPGRIVALQQKHNFSAFIGPCCSNVCAVTAKLAAYWNIAMVSPVCADQQFLDKKAFPTLTRVFGPFTKLGTFFVEICKQFGWQRISILYNKEPTWSTPAEGIRYQAEHNNITVANYLEIDGPPTHNSTVLQSKALTEISSSSRIVVISAHGEMVRSLMIEAHGQGLTSGEFIFICFMPYSQDELFGSFEWNQGDEYDSVAKQAYQALFILSMYKPDDERYRAFAEDVIMRSRMDFGYMYEPHEKVSVLAAIAHDSVWIYSLALHETLTENSDPFNGFKVTRRMWNRTIMGIQGDVTIDASGDREPAYMLKHMQSSDGQYQVIANYFGTRKVYEAVEGIHISWPGGRQSPPKDSPPCGFKGELCTSTESRFSFAVGLIVGLIAIGTLSVCILYRMYKLQQKASMMLWKIDASDVIMMESRCSAEASKLLGRKSIQASLESIIFIMQDKPSAQPTAVYNGTVCCVRFLSVRSVHLSADLLTELKRCRDLSHQNICNFIGACLDSPQPVILTEYCPKGSLQVFTHLYLIHFCCSSLLGSGLMMNRRSDILKNDSIKLDWSFKCSLMLDIVKGMDYLHRSPLHSHGRLSSSNCVVDNRFVLKVTDFGLSKLRHAGTVDHWSSLLWRAPEILRQAVTASGTQKGDVYSFGIIAQEVVYRRGPFYIPNSSLKAREIVELVKAGGRRPLRPHVDASECEDGVEALLLSCWRESASERPDFSSLRTTVKKMCPSGSSGKILDDLLSRLEQYVCNLEEVVSDRTAQLQEEKKKAEALLTQMLPRSVAAQLIAGRTVRAETYDCVTVYFSDIEGFTEMSASLTPMQVVNMLNDLYTHFDNIIDNHDVYKVETIGDAYMVVSGLPIRNGDEHAREVARMSLAVVQGMEHFQSVHVPQQRLKVRIGIHSGPCVAGVVGLKMPRYCLFGDTVNTASRMESYGLPLKIHVSSSTKSLLDTFMAFQCELRGDIHIKGKGLVRTYWLLGERR
ncbi:atrial natriuretic peptide receptor 1 [Ictalurus furcatus]|uniref:atrial natriuretic peptide receptor 1 n=1 Tax=Ictalurus furcatus TaxID=66913 RepID=UPI00234FFC65|nr:atrial natriuretic peptide receptor 1 [Ictalurus furcatus]